MIFTITDDQIARLKDFNKNLKTLSNITKQSNFSLCKLAENILTVYSIPDAGGSGFAQANFDVQSTDSGYFCISIESILTFAGNLQGPSYICTVDTDKDLFSIASTAKAKPVYSRVLMSTFSLENQFDEIETRYSDIAKLDASVNVSLSKNFLEAASSVSSTVGILMRNNAIILEDDFASASDETGRVRVKLPDTMSENLVLRCDAINLLEQNSKLSKREDWILIDNDRSNYAFIQSALQFSGFSDDDLNPQAPEDTDTVLKFGPNEFIEALNSFKGIVDTSTNKVVTLEWHVTCKDGAASIEFSYADTLQSADTQIEASSVENASEIDTTFKLASAHLMAIKDAISVGEDIEVHVNNKAQDEEHGGIIYIKGPFFDIHIAKANA